MSKAPTNPKITFNHNWNGKLFCTCFTSIRLRNDHKYKCGYEYDVILKGFNTGPAILTDVRHFHIDQINDFIALLDTGYNKEETITMLKTMYKNIVPDWGKQQISLLLFRRTQVDKKIADAPKTFSFKANVKKSA